MRRGAAAVSVAMAAVFGAGGGAEAVGPEADVMHHGYATLSGDRLDVTVLTRNQGPSSLEDMTFRVEVSAPVVSVGRRLPAGCVWGGERVVLCSTGPLAADGERRETLLDLRITGAPQELTVRVDTAWNGGATDSSPDNNDHRVIVLATGDPYVF